MVKLPEKKNRTYNKFFLSECSVLDLYLALFGDEAVSSSSSSAFSPSMFANDVAAEGEPLVLLLLLPPPPLAEEVQNRRSRGENRWRRDMLKFSLKNEMTSSV